MTVKAITPSGSIDSSASFQVSLTGAKGSLESYLLNDNFESGVGAWTVGSGTFVSDTTAAAGTTKSGKFTGTSGYYWKNGAYKLFGSSTGMFTPARASWYIRVSDATKASGYVVFREYDPSADDYYTGALVFSCTNYCLCTATYGATYATSLGALTANTWYKIDMVFDWTTQSSDIYVNDVLKLNDFPFYYTTKTRVKSFYSVGLFNYDSGATAWYDELQVVNTEATLTLVALSPPTISLNSGTWTGTITPTVMDTIYIFATYQNANPTAFSSARTNSVTVSAGCSPGTYSPTYYGGCSGCAAGTFSAVSNALSCTNCTAGTYQDATGSSQCKNCTAGTYNPNGGSTSISACMTCTTGTSKSGSSYCSSCIEGEYQSDGECHPCPEGQYGHGTSSCSLCPPGTWNNQKGQSGCTSCLAGQYSNATGATTNVCLPCPNNTASSQPGAISCEPCNPGYWSNSGETGCHICPEGNYQDPHLGCIPCPKGQYNPSPASSQCSDCYPGFFTNTTNSVICSTCPSGYYSDQKAENCTACPVGFYNDHPGRGACISCPPGQYANSTGRTNCSLCPAGSTSVGYAPTTCQLCGANTFTNASGMPACLPCDTGMKTDGTGATSCIQACGDGKLDFGEQCDDHNLVDGDGCSHVCVLESGYVCPVVGQPCQNSTSATSTSSGSNTTESPSSSTAGQQEIVVQKNESGGNTVVVVAAVAGGGIPLIILVVVVAFLLYKRKRDRREREMAVDMTTRDPATQMRSSYMNSISDWPTDYASIRSSIDSNNYQNFNSSAVGLKRAPSFIGNEKKFFIPANQIILDKSKLLGKGAFGLVYKGKWRGLDIAVKDIKREALSQQEMDAFIAEAELMANLKPHPHVVLFMGIVATPVFWIVTEYMDGGDLRTLLLSDKPISYEVKLKIIKGVATGMLHLSAEGIVHRDLAARNVLLTSTLEAKVSDFGMSRLTENSNVIYSTSDVGPLKWMSPEAIRRKKYSEKSDVWSFGVCCYEILARSDPYPDMNAVQVASAVVSEHMYPEIPSDTPEMLKALIMECFTFEDENRPTFKHICEELQKI